MEIVYKSSESINKPSMSKSAARMRGGVVLLLIISMAIVHDAVRLCYFEAISRLSSS